jgi:hypothetical protein
MPIIFPLWTRLYTIKRALYWMKPINKTQHAKGGTMS